MKSNKASVKVMTPKADRAQVDQPIAPLVKQILERLVEKISGGKAWRALPSAWSGRCSF
jgi:hypothetical protein